MAERRMFSKKIIESARFMKMPVSSQALYFHLGLRADDDGVVEAWSVLQMTGATEDDLRVLMAKGFIVVLNEDLVSYITDWREHNKIRADRKIDSLYKNLLLQLVPDVELQEPKPRADTGKLTGGQDTDGQWTSNGQPMDCQWTAQVRLGKDRLDKDRLDITTTASEIDLSTAVLVIENIMIQKWNRKPEESDIEQALKQLERLNGNFDMLADALDIAAQHGTRAKNWNYTTAIIDSWVAKGYKTEEDVLLGEIKRKGGAR